MFQEKFFSHWKTVYIKNNQFENFQIGEFEYIKKLIFKKIWRDYNYHNNENNILTEDILKDDFNYYFMTRKILYKII